MASDVGYASPPIAQAGLLQRRTAQRRVQVSAHAGHADLLLATAIHLGYWIGARATAQLSERPGRVPRHRRAESVSVRAHSDEAID